MRLPHSPRLFNNSVSWQQIILWTMIVLILFVAPTLLQPGLLSGHDSFAQITYLKLFYQALQQGQFPVRWTEWIQPGYSHPLFNFYQVGFFYLTSVFMPFVSSVLAEKIAVLLLWWSGSFFVFMLNRKLGTLPAVCAAMIYTFAPYLILDIFIRSSFPEFMAISLAPIVLWCVDHAIARQRIIYAAILALLVGLMIVSHLPATLIFTPVIGGYFFYLLASRQFHRWGLVYVVIGVLLGVGLSMFYFLPAFFELDLVNISKLTIKQFDFHINFSIPKSVYSYIWGYNGQWWGDIYARSIILGLIDWWIVLSSLGAVIYSLLKWHRSRRLVELIFWLLVVGYSLFFSFPYSKFLWEHIQTLRFIQFPWRFEMVLPLAVACLSAGLLSLLRRLRQQLLLCCLFILTIVVCVYIYLQPGVFIDETSFNAPLEQWSKNGETREQAFIEPGYMPAGVTELPPWDGQKWQIIAGDAQVREKLYKNQQMEFEVYSFRPTTFQFNVHNFPVWTARIDNQLVGIKEDSKYHFLRVDIPVGKHLIQFKLTNTPLRTQANLISLLSLLGVIGVFAVGLLTDYGKVEWSLRKRATKKPSIVAEG